MSSALPRHPDSFLGPCEAWIRSIKHCANRPPDSSSTPFRIWIPTEVQLDLLVTSKFDFLGERTKVCSERHFPAALGPETKKEGEWVWQEASPGSFVFPPRYANQPASPDNSHLLGKDRESNPPPRTLCEASHKWQPVFPHRVCTMQNLLGRNDGIKSWGRGRSWEGIWNCP